VSAMVIDEHRQPHLPRSVKQGVTYEYGGQEFTGSIRCSRNCPEVGESLTIYVDRGNPGRFLSSVGASTALWRGYAWGALIPATVVTIYIAVGMLIRAMRGAAAAHHFDNLPRRGRPYVREGQ
jgi:hypothetical protein